MPIACMITVQFFSFYRGNSADNLVENIIERLEDAGASAAHLLPPIEIPFFASDAHAQDLPDDLEKLLIESLQLRFGHDMGDQQTLSKHDEQLLDLESRLRASLEKHRPFLRRLSASL